MAEHGWTRDEARAYMHAAAACPAANPAYSMSSRGIIRRSMREVAEIRNPKPMNGDSSTRKDLQDRGRGLATSAEACRARPQVRVGAQSAAET